MINLKRAAAIGDGTVYLYIAHKITRKSIGGPPNAHTLYAYAQISVRPAIDTNPRLTVRLAKYAAASKNIEGRAFTVDGGVVAACDGVQPTRIVASPQAQSSPSVKDCGRYVLTGKRRQDHEALQAAAWILIRRIFVNTESIGRHPKASAHRRRVNRPLTGRSSHSSLDQVIAHEIGGGVVPGVAGDRHSSIVAQVEPLGGTFQFILSVPVVVTGDPATVKSAAGALKATLLTEPVPPGNVCPGAKVI